MQAISNCHKKTQILKILLSKKPGKAVLAFYHGLGDFVLFLPLFTALKQNLKDWKLLIGVSSSRDYRQIYDDAVLLDPPYGQYAGIYDILFNVQYWEPPRDSESPVHARRLGAKNPGKTPKPLLCNEIEIGLRNFNWTPYSFPEFVAEQKHPKRIGVHFSGHTSIGKKECGYDTAKKVWFDLKSAGFEPYEINMFTGHEASRICHFDFIGKDETIKYQNPNLRTMAYEIGKCEYFVGVDSGPIYLAGSIIGFDRCIALERVRKFNKVLPIPIAKVDADNYVDGIIIDILEKMNHR